MSPDPVTIADWRRLYLDSPIKPRERITALLRRLRADDAAWIVRAEPGDLEAQFARLDTADAASLPLYGVPFAVKDNIDVCGWPTTAACPAFAYLPERNASVVKRLLAAGAVCVGKTNLDQFATGLVGTRSPYGEVPNSFDAAYVSGGSSSGSASVVARGLVPFALGTDTAGSGRIPAGFNNLVGLKPTPGSVPMQGVLPACRSLDVVSIFALTVADAAQVMALIEGGDALAPMQRHAPRPAWFGDGAVRFAVPAAAQLDAALGYDLAYAHALARLEAFGKGPNAIDMRLFFEVAKLLYDGPWVAERYAVVEPLMQRDPSAIDPVVRGVIEAARDHDAVSAFRGRYALETLRAAIEPLWREFDVLVVPTAPTCPTRAQVAADPVARNSALGLYTNFVNLLGLAAIAVPAGFTEAGLPFGMTFIAPGGSDAALAALAARWEAQQSLPLGARLRAATPADRNAIARPASAPTLEIAVVGAHLAGMPLHGQLVERGCRLVERTSSAPSYKLFALPGTTPPKPGLARVASGGAAIELEVYEMPQDAVGSFLALIPAPLGLGSVQLANGRWVKGFICEPWALEGAEDITRHGGWRAYRAQSAPR